MRASVPSYGKSITWHVLGWVRLSPYLLEEVQAYPIAEQAQETTLDGEHLGVVMPLKLRSPVGVLSFISTLTVFGSPNDVTLQELAVESFFPADEATANTLRRLAG